MVDLPRAGSQLTMEVASRCDRLVLLARPSVVGVASAARLLAGLGTPANAGVVLRGGSTDLGGIAVAVGAPVLATMSNHRGLAEAVDLGLGPLRSWRGPLYRAATLVLSELTDVSVAA